MLSEEFPDATEHVVVDDIDLRYVDGWSHYYAWDLVPAVKDGEIAIDPPPGEKLNVGPDCSCDEN